MTQRRGQGASEEPAAQRIDQRIRELGDWRGKTLARVRALILEADPQVTEEWKWRGTPVWSHHGLICTGEAYAKVVKLTFARGARLPDPARLFNASLEGNTRRAIDLHEGDALDARAFKALVKAAAALNRPTGVAPSRGKAKPAVRLLSGGNPQIAKGDGDAPVQAYIAAMPGWKRDLGQRLDALIVRSVPNVTKAVRWNSPMYGTPGQGYFLGLHVFTRYVKLAFFRGAALRPLPPGPSKSEDTRYVDLHEDDALDVDQLSSWVKQAAALSGWSPSQKPTPTPKTAPVDVRDGERIDRFPDGAVKARGLMRDGLLQGAWRWYRQDGSLMRTGHFDRGEQVGIWETFDREERLVKRTSFDKKRPRGA